jgi:hypothetical protein
MNSPRFATRAVGSTKFFLNKNGPTILTGAGVVGFVATTALTVIATRKAELKFAEAEGKIKQARIISTIEEDDDRQKAQRLVKAYAEGGMILARTYAPPLIIGSASIVCILSAHGMMLKRQASLLAAYTALDAGYKAYRKRVVEKIGEEEEEALYRNVRAIESFNELGEACEIIDPANIPPSPYARFFDEASRNWTKTPEYNLLFLRSQQDWANDRLRAYGYVFLNEVYEALGLERSQAGQIVGWKLKGDGDGFVDFGLYSIGDEGNRAFVNLIEHTVLLDFNVDGPIRI